MTGDETVHGPTEPLTVGVSVKDDGVDVYWLVFWTSNRISAVPAVTV